MIVYEQIKKKLEAALPIERLNITDDSARHAGHAGARPGGQTHFKVVIVSQAFQNLPRIARHRLIYEILTEEMRGPIHALNITALTPQEDK